MASYTYEEIQRRQASLVMRARGLATSISAMFEHADVRGAFPGPVSTAEDMLRHMMDAAGCKADSPEEAIELSKVAMRLARTLDPSTNRENVVKIYKKHEIVYKMSKQLEKSLRIEISASSDLQKIVCDNTPEYVGSDLLVDAIVGICFDEIDVHVALAALRARDMKIAYNIRDALRKPNFVA